ncbi:MAG TPA: MBL fold metallo-hydrolase [Geobacteraceae bacterium]
MRRLPFRYCQLTCCAGLLDDPLLLVTVRPLGRSLLFDCGQLHHLAKRLLKSIDAVFISHAHMDHFMGVHTLIRHNHVSPRTIRLFGPPGLADRLAAAFACYDWNLCEPSWCTFLVHELLPGRLVNSRFAGPDGFRRESVGEEQLVDRIIYRTDYLQVEAALADHKIPVLLFRLTERPSFLIDGEKVHQAGLKAGPWLEELRRRHRRGALTSGPLVVTRRSGEGIVEETVHEVGKLYRELQKVVAPASLGYLTDLGLTQANRRVVTELLAGVTLLASECSFLAAEQDKARLSCHLCTSELNSLAAELRPSFLLPLHLSKSHQGESRRLYDELQLPPGVTLLRLPEHVTPRPLLPDEFPRPVP